MDRSELEELHYIVHIDNIPSIVRHGILCRKRAEKLNPVSIADQDIVEMRRRKWVAPGKSLAEYVNLYINARNAMMYRVVNQVGANYLCVIRIDPSIITSPGVIITDRNAAALGAKFSRAPDGLANINKEIVFADSWVIGDAIEQHTRKQAMCAEVLVPDSVSPKYFLGAYVWHQELMAKLLNLGWQKPIRVNRRLFFK